MSDTPQYTHRDRIKFACFSYALENGLDEEQMVDLFTEAAKTVRKTEKTALFGTMRDAEKNLGIGLGLAGAAIAIPTVAGLGGHLGYAVGQGARRLGEGRVPSVDEIHLSDETAEYKRAVEEIRRRVLLNRARAQQAQTPSNRRMF